ncbi:uncharacterized protein LOC124144634 [Haliotis rufescens]|uniref:uncharacterized protein LOC124144634 n=1 Tax=Haliotis rufescens TaxID=6454 RepID=UPI001EAFB392|nr:uncharacterized protein LOC124144634 [Haliotis rufescens]XP_046370089.1 uncharacterized protein LOC124144634 [Haliotis rufescens]
MATSGSKPEPGASFDSVIPKDKVVKGEKLGEIKVMLDGLKKSDPVHANYEKDTRRIRTWCEMGKRRYSFSYEFPEDAEIDPLSVDVPEKERSKGKFKIFFKKKTDFQLRDIWTK